MAFPMPLGSVVHRHEVSITYFVTVDMSAWVGIQVKHCVLLLNWYLFEIGRASCMERV